MNSLQEERFEARAWPGHPRFEKVEPNADQIRTLYVLLLARRHSISHVGTPDPDSHEAFVRAHPYRCWYLVADDSGHVGSVYVTDDNTIGLDLVAGQAERLVGLILEFVLAEHEPLPAVRSVRGADFTINVAPGNRELSAALEDLGWGVLQVSYRMSVI